MSFVHNQSCECLKTELDIFSIPPTQTSIEKGEWITYKPIASISDAAPIEFVISGHGDCYTDLSQTLLSITARVTKADGAVLADTDIVAPVNNWIHSLFSQVDVFLNQKMVSQPNHLYPYRSYIETLLSYNQTAKDSHLTCGLWYADEAKKFDRPIENPGFITRQSFTAKSAPVDLIARLHCDLFAVDRFLINGVELRVKLVRSKSAFNLQCSGNASYKVHLLDAALLVRKMTISPSVLLAHTKALETATAKYPISRVDLKSVTISKDVQSQSIDNLYLGQLPSRVIIGLVSNASLNGDIKTSPFNFQNFKLNFLCLYVDGRQIPSKPLQPDVEEGSYIASYHTLFTGTNINFNDDGNCIDRNQYPHGYFLHAFDLTADLSSSGHHWSLNKQGTLRLEMKFTEPLKETVSCIVYGEFKNIVEIDKYRNVIMDHSG